MFAVDDGGDDICPPAFEKFTPVCKTNDLGACSKEEIVNAYDNAILYTDFFLSKVIELLKQNDEEFETAMLYVSDHGESLGENGLYLHGLPYFLAPDAQKHVPFVMWFGRNFDPQSLSSIRRSDSSSYPTTTSSRPCSVSSRSKLRPTTRRWIF